MFLDEARLAARIRHPNVVPTLDVVALDDELFLVMDYVQGESLSRIVRSSLKHDAATPLPLIATIMAGVLHGLHAAHEAKTEQGEPLSIVHRDVSPQNVIVGIDGVPRVLDFGVAKASHRAHATREGQVKGKMAYMAPEQLRSDHVDRRVDVYAASVVLWEAVTRKRLYQADTDARVITMVLFEDPPSPRVHVPDINADLERIILRGLSRDRDQRYATAREMAIELETCLPVASASAIGGWVERLAGDALSTRARRIADIESSTSSPQVQLPDAPSAALASVPALAPAVVDEPTLTLSGINDVAEQAAVMSKVTQGAGDQTPSRSRALFVGLAAGAALVVAVVFVVISSTKRGPDTTADADTKRLAASAEIPATPTAAPAITAAPIAPTASAATPTPTARASATAAAKAPTTPVPRAVCAAPAQPVKNCKPPYTIDSSGFRHMKPECL